MPLKVALIVVRPAQLAADKRVEYILFGGGEGAPEVLPYLDFGLFKANRRLAL